MRIFRITDVRFIADPLSGLGAALAGARWNSKGTRMGYTSSSRALAMMELLVHVGRDNVPNTKLLLPIDIPDRVIVDLAPLPIGWDALPYRSNVQAVGDAWIATRSSLALRVPSAIIPDEFNVLVNPAHPDFSRIVIGDGAPLAWDKRLFG